LAQSEAVDGRPEAGVSAPGLIVEGEIVVVEGEIEYAGMPTGVVGGIL
jgi:hypothetical protein